MVLVVLASWVGGGKGRDGGEAGTPQDWSPAGNR